MGFTLEGDLTIPPTSLLQLPVRHHIGKHHLISQGANPELETDGNLPHAGERPRDVHRLPVRLHNLHDTPASPPQRRSCHHLLRYTSVPVGFFWRVALHLWTRAVWCPAVSSSTIQHTLHCREAGRRAHSHPPTSITYCLESWLTLNILLPNKWVHTSHHTRNNLVCSSSGFSCISGLSWLHSTSPEMVAL